MIQESACNLPEMQWLGVDIAESLDDVGVLDKCLTLTERDRTKARGMLARAVAGGPREARTRAMLQTMLMLGKKMEIQALDASADGFGMCQWVEEKMRMST